MRTINISISDLEFKKFGLKNGDLSFSELIDLVSREISRDNLRKSIQLGEKHGLSAMTTEDINKEIKVVRKGKEINN